MDRGAQGGATGLAPLEQGARPIKSQSWEPQIGRQPDEYKDDSQPGSQLNFGYRRNSYVQRDMSLKRQGVKTTHSTQRILLAVPV